MPGWLACLPDAPDAAQREVHVDGGERVRRLADDAREATRRNDGAVYAIDALLGSKLRLYACHEPFRLGGDAQHEARLQRVLRRVADGRGRNLDGNARELGGLLEQRGGGQHEPWGDAAAAVAPACVHDCSRKCFAGAGDRKCA